MNVANELHVQYGSDTRYIAFAFYTRSPLTLHAFSTKPKRVLTEV